MLKWLHNLKVAQKLALISFAFMVPDSVMLYLFVTSINETIYFARQERLGSDYQEPLERLLHLIPQHRLDARRGPADASRAMEIDAAFDELARVDARTGRALGFTPEGLAARQRPGCDVAGVRAEWAALRGGATADAAARDARYAGLIARVRAMIAHAGDMSNLILDPDLDSYYLMDVTLMALPQTQDRLADVMARGEDKLRGTAPPTRDPATLAVDLAFLRTADLQRIEQSTRAALTHGGPDYGDKASLRANVPPALAAYVAAATRFNGLVARVQADDRAVTVDQFLNAGHAARAAAMSYWTVANDELNVLLQDRIDHYVARRTKSLGVTACALMAASCLVMFITRSISGPLKRQASELQAANDELSAARAQLEDRFALSRAALAQTEQKYREIVENAVMGIFQRAADGRYLSANPAMAHLLGFDTPGELLARDAAANRAAYADPEARAFHAHLLATRGHVSDFQSEIRTPDGVRWVSENVRAVRGENGEILYYEGTVQDVTQRKRAEVEEQRARASAEAARAAAEAAGAAAVAASTAKSDFLATMSHEIRTPINGVTGMADLLAHTPLTEQQARYVQVIRSSSDGLLTIVNQVLDFSKIEAGKLELCDRDFDLRPCVEEVAAILAQKAAAKGLELALRIDPRLPARVRGDDDRLRQVLLNIVNNAIKFTAKGEVVVRVSAEPESAVNGWPVMLRFAVRDTGPGVPPERLGRLFQSFSQVDSSITRQHGGTGLGLAISKQLAELMGGAIGVESTPAVGSTFWFTVRLDRPETAAAAATPAGLAGRRVLVVDDNLTQCEVLGEQLATCGIDAAHATSAGAALDLLAARARGAAPFDVAIVDVNMPGMDGVALARAARATPALARLPLILMSGLGDAVPAEALDAAGNGLGQFLTKPIRHTTLLEAVAQAIAGPVTPPAAVPIVAAPAALRPTPASSPSPPPATKPTRILLVEDMDVNQFVVTETLRRHGYACDIAGDGRAAVAAATARAYDVVLMDCQMPVMSGFEAAAAIRAHERSAGTRRVTIVALTANAVAGDRERCLAAGMDDYLTKPLDPARLIARIDAVAPEAAPAVAVPIAPAVDFAALLARCDGDRAMIGRLVALFDRKSRESLAALRASHAAGDATETARLAHGLKGTAANLSALKVAALAARLETLGRSANLADADELLRELDVELDRCREAFGTLTLATAA